MKKSWKKTVTIVAKLRQMERMTGLESIIFSVDLSVKFVATFCPKDILLKIWL
jgi:hypothetical protein